MKKIIKKMSLVVVLLVVSLTHQTEANEIEDNVKAEIINYIEQVKENSKDESLADFVTVKDYYIDKMICTCGSDLMLTDYNKNRNFEDILTDINRYYDESNIQTYDLSKPEEIQFGDQSFLRDKPLDSFSYNDSENNLPKMIIGGTVAILVLVIFIVLYRRRRLPLS